jgi:soluble lytic murein transglycosylase-like protein
MGAALAFKITYDDEYAARYALHVLRHFRKVHRGDWSKMVMGYNAGNQYWRGVGYLVKVRRNLKMIQQCIL